MSLEQAVETLQREVRALRAEAEARRVVAQYMYLCDSPYPVFGGTVEERARAISEQFAEDAIWEGVGGAHANQFGRKVGRQAVYEHMLNFYGNVHKDQVFNTHYVCIGQVWSTADGVEGIWPQFQPWIYADGTSLLRSSRVHVKFRETAEGMKIAHYRTENLFIADMLSNWTKSQIEAAHLMEPVDASA